MKKENKQTRIFLRVTEREKDSWQAAAKAKGMILSQYIRATMNEASDVPPASSPAASEQSSV